MSEGRIRSSFGFRIFVAFGLTILVIAALFTAAFVFYQKRSVKANMVKEGHTLATLLANSSRTWIFSENKEMLQADAQGFMGQKNVVAVRAYKEDRSLIYAVNRKGFERRHFPETAWRGTEAATGQSSDAVRVVEEDNAICFIVPVVLRTAPAAEEAFYLDKTSEPATMIIGYVEVALDAGILRRETKAIMLRNILVAAAFLLSGSIAICLVMGRVMAPLTKLTEAVRALGRGETVEQVPVESRDEIGRLAEDFNTMFEDLRKREEEKKLLEERLRHSQKMEAVGTFARGIAHDFNNLLATIKGALYVMRKRLPRDQELGQYSDKIQTAILRAQGLVEGLFTFSRTQTVNLQPVRLNGLLRKTAPMLQNVVGKEVELRMELCEDELVVIADAFQMGQVLMNLTQNARDAMPDGGVLTIKTARAVPDQPGVREEAVLTVSDTGTGMDDETRLRIFEPFFTTKETGKGTGLGLSIVYGIIQQHGGRIEVRTAKGVETVFDIYLTIALGGGVPGGAEV